MKPMPAVKLKPKLKVHVPEPKFVANFQVREVAWCRFEGAPPAIAPEFIGEHPCVIISIKNAENLPHLVIPITSSKPDEDCPYTYELSCKPLKNKEHDYVVCSHIYSVAHQRLKRPYKKVRISEADFDEIMRRCYSRLHKIS